MFLVLEMDRPFEGMLKVSAEPLRYAYSHLNQQVGHGRVFGSIRFVPISRLGYARSVQSRSPCPSHCSDHHARNENQYPFGVRIPYRKPLMVDTFYMCQTR